MRLQHKVLMHYNGFETREGVRYQVKDIKPDHNVVAVVCYDDPTKKEYLLTVSYLFYHLFTKDLKLITIREEEAKSL